MGETTVQNSGWGQGVESGWEENNTEPMNLTGGPEIRLSQVRTPGRPQPSLHTLGLSPAF